MVIKYYFHLLMQLSVEFIHLIQGNSQIKQSYHCNLANRIGSSWERNHIEISELTLSTI